MTSNRVILSSFVIICILVAINFLYPSKNSKDTKSQNKSLSSENRSTIESNLPSNAPEKDDEIKIDETEAMKLVNGQEDNEEPTFLPHPEPKTLKKLPAELEEQLNSPNPELPEDLKAQLEMPEPQIPQDMEDAMKVPPREATLEEVNGN